MIKALFDPDKIIADIKARYTDALATAVLEAFKLTCTQVVADARSLSTYKDQTGNLRSSLGYIIYNDGELLAEDFQSSGTGSGDGSEGVERGREYAKGIAETYPDRLVGVIVAGMNYALYVESKGYDVLTGPASQIQTILDRNIKDAVDAVKEVQSGR